MVLVNMTLKMSRQREGLERGGYRASGSCFSRMSCLRPLECLGVQRLPPPLHPVLPSHPHPRQPLLPLKRHWPSGQQSGRRRTTPSSTILKTTRSDIAARRRETRSRKGEPRSWMGMLGSPTYPTRFTGRLSRGGLTSHSWLLVSLAWASRHS
uniref:Uncharacterized protein n=1 Tax=Timema monikensis TaxID=170555 RepID=A0A7R9HR57_9NEOP|nr:unnamed protein product [Timema monikensis]